MVNVKHILETFILYSITFCIGSAAFFYGIIKVFQNGINSLKLKTRTAPPAQISDKRWGNHNYLHLRERNLKLHYVEKGDKNKPLLLFLHGFPECWFSWRHQIQEFSSQFRVILLDMRGYGDSDKPTKVSEYTFDHVTEDIKHFLSELDKFDQAKCSIIGHDWGAVIAWKLVEKYPELFERHISINGPHRGVIRRIIKTSFTQLKKSWYVFLFQFSYLAELLMRMNDFEILQDSFKPKRKTEADFSDVIETYKYYWSNGGLRYPMYYYRHTFTDPATMPEKKISVPTLIIWGTEDIALSKELPKKMIELCSDIQLKWVEGAGHFVHEEEPTYVNKLIWDYIRITK